MTIYDEVGKILCLVDRKDAVEHLIDWPAVEESLGHALPSDYKQLCQLLGPGKFKDFLWLLHPNKSEGPDLVSVEKSTRMREIVDMLVEEERKDTENANAGQLLLIPIGADGKVIDPPLDDDEEEWQPSFVAGQLHPCFETDNGDIGFWVAHAEDPGEWTIGFNVSRDMHVRLTAQSLSQYLRSFLEAEDEEDFDEEGCDDVPLFSPASSPDPAS